MIKSLSRMVRQVLVGGRPLPTSQAMLGGDAAQPSEGAFRREDLKRAMEIAFAEPLEPQAGVVVEMTDRNDAGQAVEEEFPDVAPEVAEEPPVPAVAEDAPGPIAEEAVAAEPVAEVSPVELEPDVGPASEAVLHAYAAVAAAKPAADPNDAIHALAALVEVEKDGDPVEELAADFETVVMPPPPDFVVEDDALEAVVEAAAVAPPAKRPRAKKAGAAKKKSSAGTKRAAAKKAPKPGAQAAPDDEAWLSDAVAFSLSGAWPTTWSPPEDNSATERLEEFRAKAAEGVVTIWGRAEDASDWQPIKASWWKTALIEPLSFLMGRENVSAEPKSAKAKAKRYAALKVSKAAVEELWPAPAQAEVRDAA